MLLVALILAHLLTLTTPQQTCNPTLCVCSSNTCTNCLSSSFYLSPNSNQCQICDYRCSTCTGPNTCLTCSPGFYQDTTNTNTTTTSITPNPDGSFSSLACQQCPVFCQVCQNGLYCSQCVEGYVAVNGVCKICAISNVLVCESQMTVFSCLPGFWRNGDSCSPCREFCMSCTSSTNCISCVDGYRVEVSAGTYCAPCPTGCKTCSSATTCTACLKNNRLVSGTCQSIAQQCSLIQNCQQCDYSSSTVKCKTCTYPYYLSPTTNTCIPGTSLLCPNGASGPNRYQCLTSCTGISKQIDTLSNQYICAPRLWISNTDISQYYYEAVNSWDEVVGGKLLYQSCGASVGVIGTDVFGVDGWNTVVINKVFKPYYKIIISMKVLPLYKQISESTKITLTLKLTDNSTTPLSYMQTLQTSNHTSCTPAYYTIQSKIIKDQNVTIEFSGQLVNGNGSLGVGNFSKGLIGYLEIFVQVYRCSPDCRICANSKYCIQCYSNLFVYENQCVTECYGFYEFYAPNGNLTNFTSKQCLQKCPAGFYSTLHPTKNNTYICTACKSPCLTCKSQLECLSCVSPYFFYDLEFLCRVDCPLTHFGVMGTGNGVCVPCNSPCRTCVDGEKCLSCSIGYYYAVNNSCVGVCPDTYFANTTSRSCEPCDSKCSKCQNLPTNCQSCQPPNLLLNTACIASCPPLTHYPLSNKCQLCKPPCLQCLTQTKCLNCLSGYLLNNSCYSTCPDGYYSNFTANTCQLCTGAYCVKCVSGGSCEMCGGGRNLYNGACVAVCGGRTYAVGGVCVPCVQPCFQCINSTYCLSCQIGYMSAQQPGKCISQCQPSYYPSQKPNPNTTNSSSSSSYNSLSIIKSCVPCSPQCQTCKDNTTCLSCLNSSKVLDNNHQCVNTCPVGYYNHNRVCQMCNYPCLGCSTGPQVCVSCVAPYILAGVSCITQCGILEYQKDYQCYNCVYPCRTCLNMTQCTSCQLAANPANQTYLYMNSCVLTCPNLTYADPITLKCKSCNYPCLTCQDSKKCLTCATGYLNPLKSTCQLCPQTSFPNELTKLCQPCNTTIQNCRICSSSTTCRYCFPSYYFYDGRCIDQDQCKGVSNYYPNSQQMVCSPCVPPCGECQNQNYCVTCATGFLYNSRCLLECPIGYYAAILRSRCQPCDLNVCLTCSLGASSCLSCNVTGNRPILMPSQSTCITAAECPPQFYIDYSFGYGRCIKCSSPCLTCSSNRVCLSCLNGILYNGQCKTSCPISFYQSQSQNSSQNPQCLPCSPTCLQCRTTSTNCISCHQDSYLESSTCVSQCSSGFYLDPSTLMCKPCANPCKTCSSASTCLTCLTTDTNGNNLTNRIIYYGQCLEVCPDGTYERDLECVKCPGECQLCGRMDGGNGSQVVYCKKCVEGLFMNSSAPGTCSKSCQTNQYSDSYTRKCYSCQSPCQTCTSATSCSTCIQNYLIYKTDCIKGNLCPQQTFKQTNPSTNLPSCLDICPPPYYGNSFTRTCVLQCPYNYVKYPPTALCVQECPSNYYLGEELMCLECQGKGNSCGKLLRMDIRAKSIFNVLYLRVHFGEEVSMVEFRKYENTTTDMITVQYRQLSDLYQSPQKTSRLLQQSQQSHPLPYHLNPIISTNTLWLVLTPNKSLSTIQLKVSLSSHYLFAKTLQNCNSTTILTSYDQYTQEEIQGGKGFELYAKVVSGIMCILFLVNLVCNTVYMMYPMIDFYQLLFLLLFLNIDYPPVLNNFLYGFRYAHYLFLPQIFSTGEPTAISAKIPQKFGIVVPDANFLTNTGHDFLIMFVVVGVFGLMKLVDVAIGCFWGDFRSNRIRNQLEGNGKEGDQNIDQRSHEKSDTQCKASSSSQSNSQPNQNPNSNQNSNSNSNQLQHQHQHQKSPTATPSPISPISPFSLKLRTVLNQTLNRIRWNYFNDFLYIIYLYLMLFAFCQTLDLTAQEGIHYVSSIVAVVFVVVGLVWPIGLGAMLWWRNQRMQVFKEQDDADADGDRYYGQYKCYVANLKPKSSNLFGLFMSPIRYLKKALLSALFSYCSTYQNFILSIITTLSILTIVTNLIYRPYRNKLELLANCLFEFLFCIGCICLSVMMATGLGIQREGKNGLGVAVVGVYLVLSVCVFLGNFGWVVLRGYWYFTGVDYMAKYDEVDQQEATIKPDDKKSTSNQNDTNSLGQDSNLRLNLTLTKSQRARKFSNEMLIQSYNNNNNNQSQKSNKNQANSQNSGQSGQSGPMDIYLKTHGGYMRGPQVLIKCVKGVKFTDRDSDSSSGDQANQNDISSMQQDSINRKPPINIKSHTTQSQSQQQSSQTPHRPNPSHPQPHQQSYSQQQSSCIQMSLKQNQDPNQPQPQPQPQPQQQKYKQKQKSKQHPKDNQDSNPDDDQSEDNQYMRHRNIFQENLNSPAQIQGIFGRNVVDFQEDEDNNNNNNYQ